MFSNKCDCKKRELDGLCKYKFVKGDKEVLCCDHNRRKVINCIEEDRQLFIFRQRRNNE
jgi:hypothetical protein